GARPWRRKRRPCSGGPERVAGASPSGFLQFVTIDRVRSAALVPQEQHRQRRGEHVGTTIIKSRAEIGLSRPSSNADNATSRTPRLAARRAVVRGRSRGHRGHVGEYGGERGGFPV